ncbi:DEAD/DEAH box helicase [Treponema vincentii ATCC 35580]|uniref:DEAD/DEAH box helicase n=2 Tax=Treponema vincentii TaxID=69710 RepID=C8PPF9_9SPIR|nr:DEAD/DEAH box helicase [Treponema vincentii ATCC 35580]
MIVSVCYTYPQMNFSNFNLDSHLLQGLEEAGYIECTPVQEQVFSAGMDGSDLYVQSQTGTGKTAAYLVTLMQRMLAQGTESRRPALILVPTRELAVQVEEEAHKLGKYTGLRAASFYGGVGYQQQEEALKNGVDLIIGTPGRVIDLEKSKTMKLKHVGFLVIDEADRMFDMGFYPDLRSLLSVLSKAEERQTMLFSATLNTWVKNLAWEYTIDAKEITIDADNVTVDEINQKLFHVAADQKMSLLLGILRNEKPENTIIFCNTKKTTEIVAKRLRINGYATEFLIGDLPQPKRLHIIDSFKAGKLTCLVATDVAARGIDINDLAMVINYDLPNEAENYVHRIGRTARAGKTGAAYSLCSEQDVYNLPDIEKYIEAKIPVVIPGEEDFEKDRSADQYIRLDRDSADEERGGRFGRKPRPGEKSRREDKDARRGTKTARPASRTADSKRKKKGTQGEDKTDRKSADSLGGLSFEERMAYYKKQYGKKLASQESAALADTNKGTESAKESRNAQSPADKKGKAGAPANRTKNRQGQPEKKRRKGDKYVPSQTGDTRQGAKQKRRQNQDRSSEQQVRSARAPQQSATQTQPAKQKTGILGMLKKLFTGK